MSEHQTESFEFAAGRLIWSNIRVAVRYQRFLGRNIEMFEGPGWIARHFAVRGDPEAVSAIRSAVRDAIARQG